MLIKNVKANWMFIKNPDDNGKYRITISVNENQYREIMQAIEEFAVKEGMKFNQLKWKGSYKLSDEGVHTFTPKTNAKFITKSGTEVVNEIKVYDIKARRILPEEVPAMFKKDALINCVVDLYATEYQKSKGVMLGLRSIQLLKYEEYSNDYNEYENESGEPDENEYKDEVNSSNNEASFDTYPLEPDDEIFEVPEKAN